MKRMFVFVSVLLFVGTADAGGRRRWRNYEAPQVSYVEERQVSVVSDTAVGASDMGTSSYRSIPVAKEAKADDALDEVNETRRARGLAPFIHDKLLTLAARGAARHRAANFMVGHTSNDFAFIPEGGSATAAGCGAWMPGEGWGTCCTYESYTYAGAAFAIGADGRRYMHLFVR